MVLRDIGAGVSPGRSLIVNPPYEGVPPHCPYEKADLPLALKNEPPIFIGGGYHVYGFTSNLK